MCEGKMLLLNWSGNILLIKQKQLFSILITYISKNTKKVISKEVYKIGGGLRKFK